jgi:hypothetical protein
LSTDPLSNEIRNCNKVSISMKDEHINKDTIYKIENGSADNGLFGQS